MRFLCFKTHVVSNNNSTLSSAQTRCVSSVLIFFSVGIFDCTLNSLLLFTSHSTQHFFTHNHGALNLLTANVPSYRNQSVDLQSKSTDWFLYNGNIGR